MQRRKTTTSNWNWLLEFIPIFPIYGNIFNFTQTMGEVVPICSNFIKIVKIYPNDFDFIQIWNKLL